MKKRSSSCETYETLISTWLDEGLEHTGQRELLDHLARCPECREFYTDARALEGLVTIAGGAAALEEPSPATWEKIRSRTAPPPASAESWPSWGWRAAAALILGAALAFAPWPTASTADRSARQLDVVLEEDRGVMTESRFLELATEILRADRRYHFAMQEVMDKVIDDEWEPEGVTSEGVSEERDENEDEDEDEASPFRV